MGYGFIINEKLLPRWKERTISHNYLIMNVCCSMSLVRCVSKVTLHKNQNISTKLFFKCMDRNQKCYYGKMRFLMMYEDTCDVILVTYLKEK